MSRKLPINIYKYSLDQDIKDLKSCIDHIKYLGIKLSSDSHREINEFIKLQEFVQKEINSLKKKKTFKELCQGLISKDFLIDSLNLENDKYIIIGRDMSIKEEGIRAFAIVSVHKNYL